MIHLFVYVRNISIRNALSTFIWLSVFKDNKGVGPKGELRSSSAIINEANKSPAGSVLFDSAMMFAITTTKAWMLPLSDSRTEVYISLEV